MGDRIVLAVAALLLAVQISPWFYSQRDAPAYFSIARHLGHGEGLRNMGSPVLWFPPGYPLLLSPLFYLRDLPLLEISVLHWLLAVALLWGIYRWARSIAPEGAVWIAAISVGTWAVWILYRQPVSEMAFMAAMAWLLVSLQALPAAKRRSFCGIASCRRRTDHRHVPVPFGRHCAGGGRFLALLAGALRSRLCSKRPGAEIVPWRLSVVARCW